VSIKHVFHSFCILLPSFDLRFITELLLILII